MASAESSADLNRIVISYKNTHEINSKLAKNNGLLSTQTSQDCFAIEGKQICIPRPGGAAVTAQSVTNQGNELGYYAVDLPIDISIEAAITALEKSGLYLAVEKDVAITNGKPRSFSGKQFYDVSAQNYPSGEPNDVSFFEQKFYFEQHSENRLVGVGILEAWSLLPQSAVEPIDVAILDGGFLNRADLNYTSGYNFYTKNGESRGANFITSPDDISCSGHGTGVASVVGAEINNQLNLSGMVADVNIHAIKTMNCSGGQMSDAADALLWLSGKVFDGIPAYIGKAGIVNMSLGGEVDHCPVFMQTAIDAAISAGFSIVVSAGNETRDASEFAPANCDNVVTVAALHNDGNKSDFSNFGEKVTIAAPGYDIVALCGQSADDICFWGGTSFSSPIVASALALARQHAGLKVGTEKLLLAMSVNAIPDKNGECSALGCGEGLLNVSQLLSLAKTLNISSSASAKYTLDGEAKCVQTWISEYASARNLCTTLTVDIGEESLLPGVVYSLKVQDKLIGGEFLEVKKLTEVTTRVSKEELVTVLATSGSSAEISNLDFQYEICKGQQCATVPVNIDKLADTYKPACSSN